MTYGERLRELRAERRLSLRQVEERGGPNKDTMSLLERDVHKPHPQTLGRIAGALDMSVAELRAELEAAESPLGEAPPSQPSFNHLLAEERRNPTPAELNAVRVLEDDCNKLEELLERVDLTAGRNEALVRLLDNHVKVIAATTLPLMEREAVKPLLLPPATRLVEVAGKLRMAEETRNIISEVEQVANAT